jgi:hypothetical protein
MKRKKTNPWLLIAGIVIFIGLLHPSCATQNRAKYANQRQGYMLMHKSEYSMNKGHFKDTKKPKAKKKKKKRYKW